MLYHLFPQCIKQEASFGYTPCVLSKDLTYAITLVL